MKKISIAIVFFIIAAAGGWFFFISKEPPKEEIVHVSDEVKMFLEQNIPEKDPFQKVNEETSAQISESNEISQEEDLVNPSDETAENQELPSSEEKPADGVAIKDEYFLDIPFIVQAPFGNWDLPYKEACEEASVMMVHRFYQGEENLSETEMKAAIDEIIFWGDERFNSVDTSVAQTAEYFTENLGYSQDRVQVLYDISLEDIKAVISNGYPVIIPAAGRDLGNRYFQDPGPLYHMLVLIGYEDGYFIAHDPGTKRGAGYKYEEQALYQAIHDLTPVRENIRQGRKAMLIITPE